MKFHSEFKNDMKVLGDAAKRAKEGVKNSWKKLVGKDSALKSSNRDVLPSLYGKQILENGNFVGLDSEIKKLKEFDLFKDIREFKETGKWHFSKNTKNAKPKQVWLDMYDIRNSVIDVNAKVNVKCTEYMKKKPWASALDL